MDRRQFVEAVLAGLFLAACTTEVPPPPPVPKGMVPDANSRFHAIYGDPALRKRFKLFLTNIFHLYPEDKLHQLITQSTEGFASDAEIYASIAAGLPSITPAGSMLTYALPALKKQKKVMASQAAALVGEGARVDGYMEIGTVGRYLKSLKKHLTIEGRVIVVNSKEPSKDIADMVERGSVKKPGDFVPMGNYDPLPSSIADGSLDLVTNYIGFHHCPVDRLDGFVGSIRRVLRPGGRLVVREHDVKDGTMDTFVALAHDVFNAGTHLTWEQNEAEYRKFRSVAGWDEFLSKAGFKRAPGGELQAGDPTDNTLLAFQKV